MTDDELLALAQIGVGIAANEVAALIERHRVEIERLTQERDEARSWNKLYDREPNEARKKAIALRAAKWELGCCCQFDENDEQIIWCGPHADLRQRAEAALAAAGAKVREDVIEQMATFWGNATWRTVDREEWDELIAAIRAGGGR